MLLRIRKIKTLSLHSPSSLKAFTSRSVSERTAKDDGNTWANGMTVPNNPNNLHKSKQLKYTKQEVTEGTFAYLQVRLFLFQCYSTGL